MEKKVLIWMLISKKMSIDMQKKSSFEQKIYETAGENSIWHLQNN
jgi:hypothetical protein